MDPACTLSFWCVACHTYSSYISADVHTPSSCRGCNVLEALKLNCPSMSSLDATFCTQLDTLTLSRALTGAPHLDSLVLSVCMGLEPVIATDLTSIVNLSLLDLSYTSIQVGTRTPVYRPSCCALTSLSSAAVQNHFQPHLAGLTSPRRADH